MGWMCAYVWAVGEERIVMGGCEGRCCCSFEDGRVVVIAEVEGDGMVILLVETEALAFKR